MISGCLKIEDPANQSFRSIQNRKGIIVVWIGSRHTLVFPIIFRTPGIASFLGSQQTTAETPRTVLITGANSGIGLATAIDLAGKGWKVVPLCRSQGKLRETLEDCVFGKRDS